VNKKAIDRLRKACGTLPNRKPEKETKIYYGLEQLEIEIIDQPRNMYKAIFALATATWGDEKYITKWGEVTPLERYIVVASALKGKTLPTALEAPKFTFIVRGMPRHCFDQMARTRLGSGFGSIGCRDNSKIDSSIILYSEYANMPVELRRKVIYHLLDAKETYETVINEGSESWQVARSMLPMSYHHPFVFNQTLLALLSQSKRRLCFGEEEFICGIHWTIREMFNIRGYKLISNAMRPACDFVGKCLYSKSDGSELFSNLFAGCGRHKSNCEYAEWNKSCSDKKTMERQMGFTIPSTSDYNNFTLDKDGYKLLGNGDINLLEED
jgi:hypothetical protein